MVLLSDKKGGLHLHLILLRKLQVFLPMTLDVMLRKLSVSSSGSPPPVLG